MCPRTTISQPPRIHHLTVHGDTVRAHGSFGDSSGHLLVDSDEVLPARWTDSLVEALLPNAHQVQIVVGADTSNPRWITQWEISASFQIAYVRKPGEWIPIYLFYRVRGDISSFLIEDDLQRPAQFDSLRIYPGDHYRFQHPDLDLICLDTGALQPDASRTTIDPKQPPWYLVSDIQGGIQQRNLPPESVLTRYVPIHRKPRFDDVIVPEEPLIFSSSPSVDSLPYRLQVAIEDSVILDSMLRTPKVAWGDLRPGTTYRWRICFVTSGEAERWSAWWPFSTTKRDRHEPVIRAVIQPYSQDLTIRDTGSLASGLKRMILTGNNVRFLGDTSVRDCERGAIGLTLEQVDTTQPADFQLVAYDCEENASTYKGHLDAHSPVDTTLSITARPAITSSVLISRTALTRGTPIRIPGCPVIRVARLNDAQGKKLQVLEGPITQLELPTATLTPGVYLLRIEHEAFLELKTVLILPD